MFQATERDLHALHFGSKSDKKESEIKKINNSSIEKTNDQDANFDIVTEQLIVDYKNKVPDDGKSV